MSDPVDAAMEELRRLKARLAQLEKMARQVDPAPDKPAPGFADALRQLARDGTATGPGVDRLRREVAGRPEPATAPDPERLREATARLTADLRGSATIGAAFEAMQARQARLNVIESTDPGASGRVDPSAPAPSAAADRLRRALTERH